MTELQIENRQQSVCEIIWKTIINFFKKMFSSNKKCVIRSKCKDSCCCKNCSCIAALDEKEIDNSSDDIVITDDDVRIA